MTSEKETPEVIEDLDFELIIGDAGGLINNGDVPIRWCMKPEFVLQLEKRNIVDPHVLIASYYANGENEYSNEMDRKLVPLSELMTYLRFTKAGKCRVVGFLLDGAEGRKLLWERYMRRTDGSYGDIVSSWDGTIYQDIRYSVAVTSNFVEIPEGVFGREPSPWIKWYVNIWHNSYKKVTDECDFRKRFMIAFIFKWIAFIPWLIGLVTYRAGYAAAVLGCGYFKNVKFFNVFRPYKYPSMYYNVFDSPIDIIKDNLFILERKSFTGKKSAKTKMFFGLALTPILAVAIAVIIGGLVTPDGVGSFLLIQASVTAMFLGMFVAFDVLVVIVELLTRYNMGDRFAEGVFSFLGKIIDMFPSGNIPDKYKKIALLTAFGVIFIVIIAVAFKYLLAFLGVMILSMVTMFGFFFLLLLFANQILDWLDNFFAMSAKDNTYGEITELLCAKDEDNLRPNYKYIPKRQRTIRLWYHDLKNKVCKPMQS